MASEFELRDRIYQVAPRYRPGGFDLEIDGSLTRSRLVEMEPGRFELRGDGEARSVWLAVSGDTIHLQIDGEQLSVDRIDRLSRLLQESAGSGRGDVLIAPMPGVVTEVRSAPGDRVGAGEVVLVIESMKLHTHVCAERDGIVSEIPFAAGQSFEQGATLARFEPVAEGSPE